MSNSVFNDAWIDYCAAGPRPSDQPPVTEGDEGAPATRGDQPALSYRKCIECGYLAMWGTLCRACAGDKYDDRRDDYDRCDDE